MTYTIKGGATEANHYCSRTFENAIWHTHGVYEALAARPDIKPDLIVGHSGFGSTLFLRELYGDVPIINYFEYFYAPRNSDMDFRKDFPNLPLDSIRAKARNATLLLDLCAVAQRLGPCEATKRTTISPYPPHPFRALQDYAPLCQSMTLESKPPLARMPSSLTARACTTDCVLSMLFAWS